MSASPRTWAAVITCPSCHAEYVTAVADGHHEIYQPCGCGAIIRCNVSCKDGQVLYSGITIEEGTK